MGVAGKGDNSAFVDRVVLDYPSFFGLTRLSFSNLSPTLPLKKIQITELRLRIFFYELT